MFTVSPSGLHVLIKIGLHCLKFACHEFNHFVCFIVVSNSDVVLETKILASRRVEAKNKVPDLDKKVLRISRLLHTYYPYFDSSH